MLRDLRDMRGGKGYLCTYRRSACSCGARGGDPGLDLGFGFGGNVVDSSGWGVSLTAYQTLHNISALWLRWASISIGRDAALLLASHGQAVARRLLVAWHDRRWAVFYDIKNVGASTFLRVGARLLESMRRFMCKDTSSTVISHWSAR